jgi:uncharacterized protein (TIGR00251 family)
VIAVEPHAGTWRATKGGLSIRVRVTPGASRDCVDGVIETADGPAIQVRVRAVPQEGEANAATEGVVAEWLGVSRTRVSLTRGGKSRVKTIEIAGAADELRALLVARVAALR